MASSVEIDLFKIDEKALVKPTHLLEQVAAYHKEGTHNLINFAGF